MLAGPEKVFSQRDEMKVIRTLMAGAIDYAGLFPPASLSMADAVRNYARYQSGPDAWALGSFVLPLERLGEFEAAGAGLGLERRAVLSVILPSADFEGGRIDAGLAFGTVLSAEVKVKEAAEVDEVVSTIRPGITNYFEVPVGQNRADLLAAIAEQGERAKLRTGGVERGSIPSPLDVTAFLFDCARAKVAFKATAGLHHAIRGQHALTYDQDAPTEWMHGFLNVLMASALVFAGGEREDAVNVLEESSVTAFRIEENAVVWRGRSFSADMLGTVHEEFAISFGSCSFDEPIGELRSLGLT
jgi:hypothetical protein